MALTGHRGHSRRLVVAILVVACLSVEASHYRGGTVSWKFLRYDPSDSNRVEIEISHRIAWLNPSSIIYCSAGAVAAGTRYFGGDMTCERETGSVLTCPNNFNIIDAARDFICTDYNEGVPWSSGVYTVPIVQSFPVGSSVPYVLGYSGCCWASNVPTGSSGPAQYGLKTSMNLTPRSDNAQINNAPITSMFPEVLVQRGCTTNIRIPIVDEDTGDFVSCRKGADSNSQADSCYALCNTVDVTFNPSGAVGSCTLQVPPITNARSFYGVAVVVEDSYTNGGAALSTVPLHFVLRLYGATGVCQAEPTFVGSTPAFGGEVAAQGNGASGTFDIVAQSSAAGLTITEIVTLSPVMTTKTALTTVANTGNRQASITVTAGRADSQGTGKQIMCFYASQSNGVSSTPHCITVTYDDAPLDDPCDSGPCTNGGVCMPISGNADYQCTCPTGYGGKTCDQVTCAKRCFTSGAVEGCYCDQACQFFNDCCDDFDDMCLHDHTDQAGDSSCTGRCYTEGSVGGCYCDDLCPFYGDCCPNFYTQCPRPPVDDGAGGATCVDRCYTPGSQAGCYCDIACGSYGDCCADFNDHCVRPTGVNQPGEATCAGRCFSDGSQGMCYCDSLCQGFNDCCDDFYQLCPRLEGNPCEPSLCENATCVPINDNTNYRCDCPDGFEGKNCQNADPCVPTSPCQNDAPCTALNENTDYRCDCTDGFVGKNCQTVVPIEPCTVPDICQNGASCVPIGDFNYSCNCVPGFLGDNCEIEYECPDGSAYAECITECDRRTCQEPNGPSGCDSQACTEGCQCDGDRLLENDVCIPAGQCGCERDGMYYTLNTILVDENCTEECSCNSPNNFDCASLVCSQDSSCQLGDDHYECTCNEGFTGNGFVCEPVDLQCRGYDDRQTCLGSDCKSGCFKSSNYPDLPYTPNTIIQYIVQVPGVMYYTIQCNEHFNVEDDRDSLYVGPGEPPLLTDLEINPTDPIRLFDGDEAPEKFAVDGNGFWMYFITDRIVQRQGWECCWKADDPCRMNPCANGGLCKDKSDGSYVCVCMGGWTGEHCEHGRAQCRARGDPHYRTFDRLKYNFQGACKYYLLQYCGDADDAHYFDIIQKNRKVSTNSRASRTQDLWIHIFGHEIGLLQDKELTLDGVVRTTPLNYPGFSVTRSGNNLVAKFNNSLEVRWDGRYGVNVELSYEFSNRTCGLCGNMDMDRNNEFVGPGFQPVNGPVEFGNSWKANSDVCNADDESSGVHPCVEVFGQERPEDEVSRHLIFVLSDPAGPLSECHDVVDPEPIVEDALYDWCAARPDMSSACDDVASYASQCQERGVEISPWRSPEVCPMLCPANSVYNPCMTACPKMCGEEQGDFFVCPLLCVEGCECADGHVLDGDGSCVPENECGCYFEDVYHMASETFLSEDCSMSCTCVSGAASCSAATCDPAQRFCGANDEGVHGCHCNADLMADGDNCVDDPCDDPNPCKNGGRCMHTELHSSGYECKCFRGFQGRHCDEVKGNCYAHGDPHYRSFDGVKFDYQGACKYLLVKPCDPGFGNNFRIIQENEKLRANGRGPAVTKAIYFELDEIVFAFKRGKKVFINGVEARPPVSNGLITVKRQGRYLVLNAVFGLTLRWDGKYNVDISLIPAFFNNTCGLCGNWNGDPDDEFDGFDSREAYGNSWAVEGQECVSDEEPTPFLCNPNPAVQALAEQVCGIVRSDAFSSCASLDLADAFFEDCVFDLCTTFPDYTNFCSSVSLYADVCQESGFQVGVWRSPLLCPFECPENSHYSACTSPCPITCSDSQARPCPTIPCIEACECDEGYIPSGDQCVQASQCGCLERFYREPGESFANDDCTQIYTCNGPGSLSSVAQECHTNATCGARDGVHGCHCNEGYYGDGYMCQQDPCHTGEDHCSGNGRCVSNGEGDFHCVCRRGWSGDDCNTGSAVCSGHGDPHYTTFDGRRFDFQGDCQYTVLRTILKDINLAVEVVADNERYSMNSRVSLTRELHVTVGDVRVSLLQDRKVRIDNVEVQTPVAPWPGTTIKRAGKQLVLDTEYDFKLEWDGKNSFSIEVSAYYFNETHGLCGIYDEERNNDFTTPNGDLAPDVNSFGNSWVYGECGNMEPPGDSYNPCEENAGSLSEAQEKCNIIRHGEGPFGDCHGVIDPQPYYESCMYDLCSTLPQLGALCEDVAKYADDCHWEGIEIDTWRRDDFCPFICPEGSVYTMCAPGCPVTCNDIIEGTNDTVCAQPCREGCQCEEGKVLSGEECVSPDDCGCLLQGFYYKEGEDYLTSDCRSRCLCTDGAVACTPISCHDRAECVLDDGERQCRCQEPLIGDGIEVCNFNPCMLEPCENSGICHHFGDDGYWCECSDYWTGTNCEIVQGACYSFGSSHYLTFDAYVYTFQGECQYYLAKTCPDDRMPFFEVIQENKRLGPISSRVEAVHVNINDHEFTLGPRRTVKFEGEEVVLPFKEDGVEIRVRGMDVVLKSTIGVEVAFDGWYGVKVLVSDDYRNKLCGLCGDFDFDYSDDLYINGTEVSGTTFGNSQYTGQDCPIPVEPEFEDSPDPCDSLSPEKLTEVVDFCNGLLGGPFASCNANSYLFTYRCKFDACSSRLMNPHLSCVHPKIYVEICLDFGGRPDPWRRLDYCPVDCPEGSTYNPRASPCPETCVNVRRQTTPECEHQRRVEACECNEGFVLSGTACVPRDECGCYNVETENYYQEGEIVMNEDCTMLCLCQSGSLSCSPVSCDENAACTVSDGRRKCECVDGYLGNGMECREAPCTGVVCENLGTCIPGPNDTYGCLCQNRFSGDHCEQEVRYCNVYGLPHFTTFSLASYAFQGAASYFLTRSCNESAEPDFEVVITNKRVVNNPGFTITDEIWIRFQGMEISLRQDLDITVNGLEILPPYSNDLVEISAMHNRVIVSTNFGLAVEYDGFSSTIIALSTDWAGRVCGLCGDMGGPVDEEIAASISNPVDIAAFGDRNIAYPGDNPPVTMPRIIPECSDEEKEQIAQLCAPLIDPRGPFRRCRIELRTAAHLSCQDDSCAFIDDIMTPICQSLSIVAKQCQSMHTEVDPWRMNGACPVHCPEHAVFKYCSNACQRRCGQPVRLAQECPYHCEEGCECEEGYVLDHDGKCVQPEDCGCFDEGYYHLHDEEYYRQDCREVCHCEGGEPNCEAMECHENATCTVRDGDYGCHCNHGYRRNGTECIEDPCYRNPCDNDGICVVTAEDGPPYKCVCRGRWTGDHCDEGVSSCSVSGHTHYDRFDGEVFNFYGTCSYVLARACAEPQNPFEVILENEPDDEFPHMSRIEAVHIVIGDQNFWLKKRMELTVNGEEQHYPYIQAGIEINQYGWLVKVSTDFGLTVAWNGRDLVDITLPSDYADGVCGICGAVANQEPGLGDYPNANGYGTAWLHNAEQCPEPGDEYETCADRSCNLREAVQKCSILMSPQVACPTGWFALPTEENLHICYYVSEAEEGLTYAAAQRECQTHGGRLYDPRTESEAWSFRNATVGLLDGPFWLGCSDEGHEGRWTCGEGGHFWSQAEVTGYWAWDEDQPNDADTELIEENCALIYDNEKWRDVSCKARAFHLVCQLESRREFLFPFQKCHDVVQPHSYFANCIQNLCSTLPDDDKLCSSLSAYDNICQLNGVDVGLWRSRNFCPLECPEGASLNECVSPCPPTCAEPNRSCALPCRPGCACREGTVRQGPKCVPKEECGCFMASMGRFIEPGDSIFKPDCEELCHCLPGGTLDCQEANCTDNATCVAHEPGPGFTCQCDEGFIFMDNECQPDACAGVECANGGRCVALHEEYSCFCERGWTGDHCEEEEGWCQVHGFSHYRSFDGKDFNFFGDCVYHLAGHCGQDVGEPVFWILGNPERHVLQRDVASLYYVEIHIDDQVFKLKRDHVVTVDGVRRNLPITAYEGIRVELVGNTVVFHLMDGLWVSWDGYSNVNIRLSERFKNKTCGLCGNFDGDEENDLVPKDGNEVVSPAEFGNSWVQSDEKCHPDEGNLSPTFFRDSCGDRFPQVMGICTGLMAHLSEPCGGPDFLHFYVHGCIADICLFSDSHYGCSYAAAAVAACKARGGRPAAREMLPEPCRAECPANSDYSFCTSPCPRTCDDVRGLGRPPCQEKPCVEGCQCKEGFVRSGLECVPEDKCGCRDSPFGAAYYLDDEEFVRRGCNEKCECDNGAITCEPMECHCEAECSADEYGRYGCHCEHPYVGDGLICTVDPCYSNPCVNHGKCMVRADFSYVCVCPPQWTGRNCEKEQKECSVYGSPQHFSTFDGANFNFFGECLYTLAADCAEEPWFRVLIRNEPTQGRPGLTKVKDVYVHIGSNGPVFGLHQHKKVTVNKRPVSLPYGENGTHVVPGQQLLLTTPFGLNVRWNGYFEVDVWLDAALLHNISLCGLCGNADGDSANILDETPDGTRVSNSVDFGYSWRVPDEECADRGSDLQDACNGDIQRAAATLTCQIIVDANGPFGECIAQLDPAAYLENCIFTACSSGDPEARSNICSSLLTLESACLDRWLPVGFWRAPGFCAPPCGRDSQFKPSAPACPKTCLGFISERSMPCPFPNQAGCVCDPHLYLSGDECVPKEECGCYYDGQYRKVHEVFLADECEQTCTCMPGHNVECRRSGCPEESNFCGVKEGVYGCHCRKGFEDDGCGGCRANPCYPNPCQNNATCVIIEDDDYACQCPAAYGDKDCGEALARCTVSGDPHIETFDGVRYHFSGECEYILLHNCFEDGDKFTVTQVTERSEENPNVVTTKMIKIYSASEEHGYQLELRRGFILLINGQRVIPPLILPTQQIHFSGSWMVLVDHYLDLVMRWDGYNHVDIFVHSKLGEVCGLCGFYDGDSSNDFLMHGGESTSDAVAFANSWVHPNTNSTCDEAVAVPNGCEGDAALSVSADNACNAIRDIVGSLAACHDVIPFQPFYDKCHFDVCKSLPDTSARCAHIQDYAQRCINAGVDVGHQWRMERNCFFECPEHSHFSSCIGSCPASCLGERVYEDPRRCVTYCSDGCECDEGYYLSNDRCVPEDECGCLIPHEISELAVIPVGYIYMTEGCEQSCECGADGTLTCMNVTCSENAECLVVDGVQRCVCTGDLVGDGLQCNPNQCDTSPCSNGGTCHLSGISFVCVCARGWSGDTCTQAIPFCLTYGDPHYRTFDGVFYDFMGECSYRLVVDTNDAVVSVIQVNQRVANTLYTAMKELIITYGGREIRLVPDVGVLVDGVLQTPPFSTRVDLETQQLVVHQVGNYIVVKLRDVLDLKWDGRHSADIDLLNSQGPVSYNGLCGNANDDDTDDLDDGNPTTDDSPHNFGNSQTVATMPCPQSAVEQPHLCNSDSPFGNGEFADAACQSLDMNHDAFPFQDCTEFAPRFHTACRYDVCAIVEANANLAVPIACGVIATYAQLCQDLGHTISEWRSASVCSQVCPRNSEYSLCAEPCPLTCRDPNGGVGSCFMRCAEGCQCRQGYYQDGDECVPRSQCGCLYDSGNKYLKLNDAYYTDTCTMRCTCSDAFGDVVCVPSTCHENATCEFVHGIQKCVCDEGFVGDGQNCVFEECANAPCAAGTQCLRRLDGDSDYVCECLDNLMMGKDCDVPADYNNRFACYGESCGTTWFESLNYPERYPNSHKAFYQVWVPGAKYFRVTFDPTFEVESDRDFLYIGPGFQYPLGLNQGPLVTVPGVIYQLNGYTTPGPIYVEGDAAWMYFESDDQVDGRGWHAELEAVFEVLQGSPVCWDGSETRLSDTTWDYGKCDECQCAAGAVITCSLNASQPISCDASSDCPSGSTCVPPEQVPLCMAEPCDGMYCDVGTIYANCDVNPHCAILTISTDLISIAPGTTVSTICDSLIAAAEVVAVAECFVFECAVRRDARRKRAASDETVLLDIYLESGSPATGPSVPVSQDGTTPADALALTLYERLSRYTGISDGSLPINITGVIYHGPRPITKAPPTSSSEKVTVKKVTAGPVDSGMPTSTVAIIAAGASAFTLLLALTVAIWCRHHGRKSSKKTMTFQEASEEAHANEAFEMIDHGPAFSRAIPLDDGTGHQGNVYGVKYDLES